MKPRTKLEREVTDLSKILTPCEKGIKKLAFESISRLAFHTSKNYWCSICDNTDSLKSIKANNNKCSCGETLTLQSTRSRQWSESFYLGFAEVLDDFQVIRHFLIEVNSRKGFHVEIKIDENIQHFIKDNRTTIISRNLLGLSNPKYGEMSIKKPSYYNQYCYAPTIFKYHEWSSFPDSLTKRGVSNKMINTRFENVSNVISYSHAETILKAERFDLFQFAQYNIGEVIRLWGSVKLAIKHNYMPSDVKTWFDHLELLRGFGKDLRSPKYIFPNNLAVEHQKLIAKRRKIDEQKADAQKRNKAIQDQKDFMENKAKFFGLKFEAENISIKVLESIEEFIEQGDIFKHCVFTNNYHTKDESLIFAAYYNDVPVETVEVSLQEMKVVQSRGLQNKASEYNSQIVELVNRNMNQIAQLCAS